MSASRFEPLGKAIDDFAGKLDNTVPQADTIQMLLRSLHVFGETLYGFFKMGFDNGRLEKSKHEPPEYVEGLLLDKIARDLDAILSAYLLRVPLSINARDGQGLGFTRKLALTDDLAHAALKRASQLNLPVNAAPLEQGNERTLANTDVLTYFDRSMQIRIIPYAPCVLISVPLSGLNRNLDLTAIAHETGHVIFRSGELVDIIAMFGLSDEQTLNMRFRPSVRARLLELGSTIPDSDKWYTSWFEEMFADVYGCLVAGPYVARHFLELSQAWRSDGFGAGGGTAGGGGGHPLPAVRPLIFSAALREIPHCFTVGSLNLGAVADRLDVTWLDHLARRGVTHVALPGEGQPLTPTAAGTKIQEAVREILLAMTGKTVSGPQGEVEEPKQALDDLPPWPALESWQSALDEGQEPAYAPPRQIPISQPSRPALTKEQAEQLIAALLGEAGRKTEPIAPADWNRVLTFGGWLDKGPEGGKAH